LLDDWVDEVTDSIGTCGRTSEVCKLDERNSYALAPSITVIPAQAGIHCWARAPPLQERST
jgi:hypothetical protein